MSDRVPDRAYDDRATYRARRKLLARWRRRGVTAAKYAGGTVAIFAVLGFAALAGLGYGIYRLILWIGAAFP